MQGSVAEPAAPRESPQQHLGLQTQNLHLCHLWQSFVFPEKELSLLIIIQDFTEG